MLTSHAAMKTMGKKEKEAFHAFNFNVDVLSPLNITYKHDLKLGNNQLTSRLEQIPMGVEMLRISHLLCAIDHLFKSKNVTRYLLLRVL